MSFASGVTWACRAGIVLSLFGCNSCGSGGGSEPVTLTGLSVTPTTATLAVGLSRQLLATASYSDNSTANRTSQAAWSSTAPGVATVAAGVVSGISAGDVSIIASLGGKADTAQLTITLTQPTLSGVTVTPDPVTIALGGTRSLTATANYSDGSFGTVTAQASWASTAPGIATVAADGVVSGIALGTAEIVATFGAFSDTSHITVTVSGPAGYVYPLKVGSTSRYLVDQDGKPFFLVGDAAWSLIAQLSYQDAETYLAARQQHGFNLVMVNLIEHEFATNAPANINNDSPFSGAAFAMPNEAYFAHADSILQSAGQKGIVVLLAPAYVGFDCGSQGWASELQTATTTALMEYGRYVGARYRNYDNIIWLIGGDADPGSCGVTTKLQAVVDGILQTDNRHLFTAHNAPESMAIDPWGGASWLTVNNVYTYSSTLYQAALSAYQVAPAKPYFLIESEYDGEGASAQGLRAQSYWTVLSGGMGHVYGACPMWHFGAPSGGNFCSGPDWPAQLTNQGTLNMRYLHRLFTARLWHLLVPDAAHTALTNGFGSGTSYATAAVASDGSSIIAYLPDSRTVTLNGTALGASMKAWWYDPSTGTSTLDGTYPTTGAHDFTPPGSGDWVLVVDNANLNFPAP